MKDYTSLYSEILFYTKELERLENELLSPHSSDAAKSKLTNEKARIKARLDALTEKIPEISENS